VIASTQGSGATSIDARYGTMVTMSAARLGRYELGEIIGTGGVAEAWRASYGNEQFRKTVVVKRVRPELREHAELHEAFLREARLAQRLQHGNVVQVLDVGDDDGVPYIVLEHVDGCSLQVLMEKIGALPVEVAVYIAEQVTLALQHAHAAEDEHGASLGLVHRDVTPGNVLLSKDGVVKLGDFGIARVRAMGSDTLPGFIKGTPLYLAPEQAAGRPVDARADLYSLGLVLRRMLVGDGELGTIDLQLAELIEAATEPAVRDRLSSAAALLAGLQSFRAARGFGSGSEALAQLVRTTIGKPQRRAIAIDAALKSNDAPATVQVTTRPLPQRSWIPQAAALLVALVIGVRAWDRIAPPTLAADTAPTPTEAPPPPQPEAPPPRDAPADPQPLPPTAAPSTPVVAPPTPKPVAAKKKGRLEVQRLVPWAEVSVDDESWGRTPQARPLAAGSHRVKLYNPATGGDVVRDVVIEPGKTTKIASWR
jgi:serine/threonine-protein kinase